MDTFFCSKCGHATGQAKETEAGVFCPQCGGRMERESIRQENVQQRITQSHPLTPKAASSDQELKRYPVKFTGSAGEYFRIWIVNTFLTVITLGIYAAWAKVRTRRYFYKNTLLEGHAFDYTANPVAILKGYLILAFGLILYNVLIRFSKPQYALALLGLFFLTFPILIHKSLRFFAHNSVYRNIRFRFSGGAGKSYKIYMLFPLLIPLTLGLIAPYWAFLRKQYFYGYIGYGTSTNSFQAKPGPFYKVYILTALVGIGLAVLVGGGFAMVIPPLVKSAGAAVPPKMIIAFAIPVYLGMIIAFTGIQQYLFAWTTNYCFTSSQLGLLQFESTLHAGRLVWIRISNIIAIIFSLGLLAAWAKVRHTRYLFDNLTVLAAGDLNEFASAAEPEEGAYGDAATEFFDLEIAF